MSVRLGIKTPRLKWKIRCMSVFFRAHHPRPEPAGVKIRPRTTGELEFACAGKLKNIRAADAKEVGVGNPAEETCCCPNRKKLPAGKTVVNRLVGRIL
jgi:hypothetical protein